MSGSDQSFLYALSRRAVFRGFAGLGLTALTGLPLRAADGVLRIVVLETMTLPGIQARTRALRRHLADFGLEDGHNLRLLVLNIEKDRERGAAMLKTAIRQGRPDLVVTVATVASQAGRDVLEGTGIPQVFLFVSDPVGAGLVPAVERPSGTNITGVVQNMPRSVYVETMLRLLRQTAPRLPVRIGLLHSTYPASVGTAREVMDTVENRDDISVLPILIEQKSMPAGIPEMLDAAGEAVRLVAGKIDYLWLGEGPIARQADFVNALLRRMPRPFAMGTSMISAQAGALAALDSDPEAEGRSAAVLCQAILKGTDPATIPVMRNQIYRLGLNATTTEQLGVTLPPDLIAMAGDNLFR